MKAGFIGVFFVVIASLQGHCDENGFLVNAYDQIRNVYLCVGEMVDEECLTIRRGGGIDSELDRGVAMTNFLSYCVFVSNNVDRVMSDWNAFETNETARFTTMSAIAHCGVNYYTNFCNRVLITPVQANCQQMDTAYYLLNPYGTPLEHYLSMNYDTPGVSNIINRIREIAIRNNATETAEHCLYMLSGDDKRECLMLREAGML